jgi:site-specific DNA-methyltransferase (adenine-specific)
MKDVWNFTAPKSEEKKLGKHPTQKPLALLERILRAASRESDLVLDPFLGSGTTAVAASRLGRRCLGIEYNASMVAVAAARLAEAQQVRVVQSELVL